MGGGAAEVAAGGIGSKLMGWVYLLRVSGDGWECFLELITEKVRVLGKISLRGDNIVVQRPLWTVWLTFGGGFGALLVLRVLYASFLIWSISERVKPSEYDILEA